MSVHLPLGRLENAAGAGAAASAARDGTRKYANARDAFGQPRADFQIARFTLADIATEIDVSRAYLDKCILAFNEEKLSAVDAAKAKLWTTEVQNRVIDRCLQLHGGYGYIDRKNTRLNLSH